MLSFGTTNLTPGDIEFFIQKLKSKKAIAKKVSDLACQRILDGVNDNLQRDQEPIELETHLKRKFFTRVEGGTEADRFRMLSGAALKEDILADMYY